MAVSTRKITRRENRRKYLYQHKTSKKAKMSFSSFEELEQNQQQIYDDIKLHYPPCTVLSVTLLGFKNISDGFFDNFDTPDPQFEIICPKITDPKLRSFKTDNILDDVTEGEVYKEYCFVIPENITSSEEFPLKIILRDLDVISDDWLGEVEIDTSKLEIDGEPVKKKLQFRKNENSKSGELDVILRKRRRTSPDIRYSLGLCPEEKEFRKKRIPLACKAMQNLLGKEKGPQDEIETPIVSLAASGGGYRSVIAMCGVIEALHEAGIFDTLTYVSALSGGAWYFAAAHAAGAVADKYKEFHDGLRENMSHNLFWEFINPMTISSYKSMADDCFGKFSLPQTFVNYFPGYLVSKHLFGEDKLNLKLSDLAKTIDTGEVPYLVVSALHVKNRVAAHRYHAYVERSPHEIYIPSYGIGLKPENETAVWNNGIRLKTDPEYPLFFTTGMTGCAFSILLNQYFKYGDEGGNTLFKKLDSLRLKDKYDPNKNAMGEGKVVDVESEDEDDDDDDSDKPEKPDFTDIRSDSMIETAAASALVVSTTPVTPKMDDLPAIASAMRNSELFTSRNKFIGRTAKSPNFARNSNWKRYHLNPLKENLTYNDEQKTLIKLTGHKTIPSSTSMPKTSENLSFVDAGILKNVPTESLLRPQRGTDLMIVIDANAYDDDDDFDYQPLLSAAAHAAQSGLKFPEVKYQEVLKTPPKELLNLKSNCEGCPTVLWFTLCNKKFKQLENYVPRTNIKPPGDQQKFNDFKVFGKGSAYSTFSFHQGKYQFEQLKELMHFNVTSHIEDIKEALSEATARKRRKVGRQ